MQRNPVATKRAIRAILKAAEDTPLSAWAFGVLARDAGVPDGVYSTIHGFGEEAGAPEVGALPLSLRLARTAQPALVLLLSDGGSEEIEIARMPLADAHALCDRNGSVDVSLRAAAGGATNLTYTITGGSNGTVSLLSDGYTAHFVAAANTNGLAGFTFTATDPIAAASFGPVSYGVLITTTNAPVSNTPPVLAAISNRTVIAGNVVSFTCSVTDTDTPPQTFTYSLQNGPAGATLNTNTGSFSWRPTIAQSGTTNTMSITVSDNGSPVMSATQAFSVAVLRPAQPLVTPGPSGSLPPALTVSGDSGPDYIVQASTNLINWLGVFTTNPAVLPFSWTDPEAAAFSSRFYRIVLGP